MTLRPTIGELADMLAAQVDGVVQALLPGAVRNGAYWSVGDIDGTPGKSLFVHRHGPRAGKWSDAATDQYGDLIDLIEATQHTDLSGAISWACDHLGIEIDDFSDPPSRHEIEARKQKRKREAAKREAKQEAENRKRSEIARSIWDASKPATDTLAQTYLRARGITLPPPPSLKYHGALRHGPTGLLLPCLVAAVQGPDGEVVGIHRTSLREDGRGKAGVSTPKMSLGPIGGGAVRLAQLGEHLIVGEGIETALSVQQATELPAWAALSAGGIESLKLPPLPMGKTITIAADHDDRGLEAADNAARQWVLDGREVRIAKPLQPGTDFNDLLVSPTNVVPFPANREAANG